MTVLTQTKLAIDNLYTRIRPRQTEKEDPDLKDKLAVLLERILDLSGNNDGHIVLFPLSRNYTH